MWNAIRQCHRDANELGAVRDRHFLRNRSNYAGRRWSGCNLLYCWSQFAGVASEHKVDQAAQRVNLPVQRGFQRPFELTNLLRIAHVQWRQRYLDNRLIVPASGVSQLLGAARVTWVHVL